MEKRGRGERDLERKERREEEREGRTSLAPLGQECVCRGGCSFLLRLSVWECSLYNNRINGGGGGGKRRREKQTTGAAEVSLTGWGISRSKR